MIQYLLFDISKLLNISEIAKRTDNFFKLSVQLFYSISYPELALKGYFIDKTKEKDSKSEGQFSISKRLASHIDFDSSKYGFTDNGTSLVSWIDTFFFANLHIIGITLDFSEIDIWWLLSRRARLLKSGLAENQIYYYPTFPLSEIHLHLPKLRLLERMGVNVVYHRQTIDIETGYADYPKIYNEPIDNIQKIITVR